MDRKYSKQARWFTQNASSKMFVSLQKYHGIQIAVRSTVKVVKCLLENDCIFLSSGRLGTCEKTLWYSKATGRELSSGLRRCD